MLVHYGRGRRGTARPITPLATAGPASPNERQSATHPRVKRHATSKRNERKEQQKTPTARGINFTVNSARACVRITRHNNRATGHTARPIQLQQTALERDRSRSRSARFHIAQIAGVTNGVCGAAVLQSIGVEVRAKRGLPLRQVPVFVNAQRVRTRRQTYK